MKLENRDGSGLPLRDLRGCMGPPGGVFPPPWRKDVGP